MELVPTRRSYGSYNDGCASAHALDLIGERWALIVIRELLLGPKRFADLERDVVGIGPAVLSQRLRDLEEHGIVRREPLPPPAGRSFAYALTEWGSGLEAVNAALSLWAVASPELPLEADMSPDTVVLAMRAHARPAPASARVRLELTDSRGEGEASPSRYLANVSPAGAVVVKDHRDVEVDAVVRASSRAWKGCVIGGAAPADVDVEIEGDVAAVDALLAATRL